MKDFAGTNTDTLLHASQVSMQFSIADIVNKKYTISGAGIRKGKLNVLTDASGAGNYGTGILTGTTDSENSFVLNLDRITLDNVEVAYNNLAASINISSLIEKGKLSTRISKGSMMLHIETDAVITRYEHKGFTLGSSLSAGIDVNLEKSGNSLGISSGKLFIEGISLELSGSVSTGNEIDFKISGKKIDVARAQKYFPEHYSRRLKEYDLKGVLTVESSVKGKISETENPHVELDFVFENGSANNHITGLNAGNIYIKGAFSNGSGNSKNTSVIAVSDLNATIGSGSAAAKLKITNLNKPFADIELQGSLYPAEIRQFFALTRMPGMSGYCDVDLKLKAPLPPLDSMFALNLLKHKPRGTVDMHSIDILQSDSAPMLSDINGNIVFSEHITASNLKFKYGNQQTTLAGKFENLPEWLAGNATMLKADADIHFEKLSPMFLTLFQNGKQTKGKAFKMPRDISLNLHVKADSLIHDRLPASGAEATIVYRPGLLTFSSFNIKTLNGTISGNGFVLQDAGSRFTGKGIFNVNSLGIKKTFTAFSNFGQNFITAENLNGNFTGSVTLLLPADSLFRIDVESVMAEGKFTVSEGSLVNFEPVKKLSSFIELSELENIRFDKLENDFFIRNNRLSIPQMEVMSSAADFSVNGTHGFSGNFEYHIKIRLSELLSRKRKNSRSVTEFGAVEDDGLGRTSVFLIAQNNGNTTKISYDVKAAGAKVKTGIKSEKQNIRSILNQEYGLFRNDSTPVRKPVENKPRFRVEWE
jgi:hypothetical protein